MIVESDISRWVTPISETSVCGENLEYDADFTLLLAKLQPKEEVQFGDFVEAPEPLNWSEIEKETLKLLDRTRDINLVIILTRCWVRLQQGKGLLKGVRLLHTLLQRFPDALHPQLVIDGELDPLVRANALGSLSDPQGLLGDIRDISLIKSSAWRLQVRDIERAFTTPRPAEALAPDSVFNQLQELLNKGDVTTSALVYVAQEMHALNESFETSLGHDAPDLRPLLKALHVFTLPELTGFILPMDTAEVITTDMIEPQLDQGDLIQSQEDQTSSMMSNPETTLDMAPVHVDQIEGVSPPVVGVPSPKTHSTAHGVKFSSDPRIGRRQAVEELRRVRLWFEQYEPSSPVPILLKQAEHLVGKRFIDMAQQMPLDILHKWDQAEISNDHD